MNDTASKIRELNDLLRTKMIGGKFMISAGLSAEGQKTVAKVLQAVRSFKNFNQNNDPYKEHDMGIVNIDANNYIWKIDYYDLDYMYHSPDAANPLVTKRVLTICKDIEY